MERPKNYAPKEMEDTFTLYVKENEIVLAQHKEQELLMIGGKTINNPIKQVSVKCAPEDEFDIAEAVKIAMQRLQEDDKIRVGDTVKIVNPGSCYADLPETEIKDVPFEYVVKYRYGVVPEAEKKGSVVYISNKGYIFVQVFGEKYKGNADYKHLPCRGAVYCLSRNALKKIKDGRFE